MLTVSSCSNLSQAARYSASPVLTATGFVNGKGQFSTPTLQNRHPSTDHQKICHRWLSLTYLLTYLIRRPPTAVPNYVHICPQGLLGTWVNYNQNIFIYTLFGNSPTGQTRRQIFTHDGSNDADSRKDVPFLV